MSKSADVADAIRAARAMVARAAKPCDMCDSITVSHYEQAITALETTLAEVVGYNRVRDLLTATE